MTFNAFAGKSFGGFWMTPPPPHKFDALLTRKVTLKTMSSLSCLFLLFHMCNTVLFQTWLEADKSLYMLCLLVEEFTFGKRKGNLIMWLIWAPEIACWKEIRFGPYLGVGHSSYTQPHLVTVSRVLVLGLGGCLANPPDLEVTWVPNWLHDYHIPCVPG